ncbi:MAG: hypothetical protein CMP22_03945 [Rickettsiales bacterium]|nr:hypothetical protein [Rickettsiales bacterium]
MVDRQELKKQLLELINKNRKRVPEDVLARAEKLALAELERQQQAEPAMMNAMAKEITSKEKDTPIKKNEIEAPKEINMRNFPKINLQEILNDTKQGLMDTTFIDARGVEVVKYNRQAASQAVAEFINKVDDKKGFLTKLKEALHSNSSEENDIF